MKQADPTFVPKKLIYRLSKADYQKRFGNSYQRPGVGARLLAFLLKLIPKIGPLKDLSLRVPSADAQKHFLSGMDNVVDQLHQSLDPLRAEPADRPSLKLASLDLDTGKPTAPAEYALADQTYARYLALLVKPRPPAPPPTPSAPWPAPEPARSPAAGNLKALNQKGQPPAPKPARPPQPAPAPPAQRATARSKAQPATRRSRHPRRHRALLRPLRPRRPPAQEKAMEGPAEKSPDPPPTPPGPTGPPRSALGAPS